MAGSQIHQLVQREEAPAAVQIQESEHETLRHHPNTEGDTEMNQVAARNVEIEPQQECQYSCCGEHTELGRQRNPAAQSRHLTQDTLRVERDFPFGHGVEGSQELSDRGRRGLLRLGRERTRSGRSANLIDHVQLLFEAEATGTGQANAAPEEVRSDFSTVMVRPSVERL